MSETTEGVELAVPDEARRTYDEVMIDLQLVAKGVRAPSRTQYGNIRAIAAPVVAAELRRLAKRFFDLATDARDGECFAYSAASEELYNRADELKGQS